MFRPPRELANLGKGLPQASSRWVLQTCPAHSSRSPYPNTGPLLVLISVHLPDRLVSQVSIILCNRTMTKKRVKY